MVESCKDDCSIEIVKCIRRLKNNKIGEAMD